MEPPLKLSIVTQPIKGTKHFKIFFSTDPSNALGLTQVKPGLYALTGYPGAVLPTLPQYAESNKQTQLNLMLGISTLTKGSSRCG
jgi:hypothetical protein